MFTVGLTGSVATGKSTVTRYLINKGYIVLDADKITHDSYNKGTSCYLKVVETFDCLDDNKDIDRQRLGDIVFNDASKKKQLEDIVHPYVIDCLKQGIKKSNDDIIFLDIPLLYESHLEYLCDKIMVVYVDKSLEIKRLMARNHCSKQSAIKLIDQQIDIEDKREKGDYVLDNRGSEEDLYKQVERILKELENEVLSE